MTQTLTAASGFSSDATLRVLTADADGVARGFYRQLFARDHIDVVEAADGRDALVKALVRRPSLVVTELRLPYIDGVSLCEILRKDRSTADVPIIVATSQTHPDELARAKRIADAVLLKPTSGESLLSESARLLANVDQLRELLTERSTTTETALGRSATLLRTALELHRSIALEADRSGASRSKTHLRYNTTDPPLAPPVLSCPCCDRPLAYEISYVGGVTQHNPEQWDYFICAACGTFQYRHRTRKLRQLPSEEEEWLTRIRMTPHY